MPNSAGKVFSSVNGAVLSHRRVWETRPSWRSQWKCLKYQREHHLDESIMRGKRLEQINL